MKEIRVFPRRTKWTPIDNDLAVVGDVPLLWETIDDLPVKVSVTFTWDIPEGLRLQKSWSRFYSDVQIGGPAFDDPGKEFSPGRFVKKGMITTSRGCPKNCPWCLVPRREGPIRELLINPGWNLFDNNLLACSREHIEAVFDMLRNTHQPAAIFSGGLDITLLKTWHIDLLKTISKDRIYFACDTVDALPILEKAADLLSDFPQWLKYCYVLVGLNGESLDQAENRLIQVFNLGFLPMAIFYQGYDSRGKQAQHPDWRKLIRKWSAPARYKAFMRDEFDWNGTTGKPS